MSFKEYVKEAEEKEDNVDEKIIQFFVDNPYPEDDKVHGLAEELGMEPDDFESKIYAILSDIISGGIAGKEKIKTSDVDSEQLSKGREVEKEHTSIPQIAEIIALSHLAEDPKYYSKLEELKL